jgi:magnesium-transporting ATPase (P-type)
VGSGDVRRHRFWKEAPLKRSAGEGDRPPAAAVQWHTLTSARVLTELRASAQGLEEDDAARRLAAYGANRLPEPPKRSAALRLLLQFHNVLIYVLLGAAAVTFALDHLTDTLVILAVVILNAVIGFLQEGKAEKAMGAIRRMLALQAAVMRAGQRRTVEGEALVPGDIVLLEAGDKVPADLRLLHAAGLQVQEAILTGESVPVEKGLEACAADAPLGDRSCMAYSGTLVTEGGGR